MDIIRSCIATFVRSACENIQIEVREKRRTHLDRCVYATIFAQLTRVMENAVKRKSIIIHDVFV